MTPVKINMTKVANPVHRFENMLLDSMHFRWDDGSDVNCNYRQVKAAKFISRRGSDFPKDLCCSNSRGGVEGRVFWLNILVSMSNDYFNVLLFFK